MSARGNVFARDYVTYTPQELADLLLECREERLLLIWRIINRTYDDHLIKPKSMPKSVWEPLRKRFTVTDLASPVLSTINSATYGGKVHREVTSALVDVAAIERFMAEARYGEFMPVAHRYAAAYGTSFSTVGRKRRGKRKVASLAHLHPILTRIVVPDTDVEDVQEVSVDYGDKKVVYTASGIREVVEGADEGGVTLPNSGYGFIPVTIGRGRWMDACTPYGQDLIWPAVEETKQITALMCDLMVLERNQSYSTLVIKGSMLDNPKDMKVAPWVFLRGQDTEDGGDFDAKWISPDAKIDEINKIIESKFERAATQCQVPVELFVRAKAGTMQGTGAAMLQHKPLYDLVIEQQRMWRDVELDLVARISAFIAYENTGQPQDLDAHRDALEMVIEFEHETHPSYNQAEVQTWLEMRDNGLKTDDETFFNFNRRPNWKELKQQADKDMEARRADAVELAETRSAGVGDGSDAAQQSRDRDGFGS